MKSTWLDRAIGWASPARGAERLRSRKLMEALAYDGATAHRSSAWTPSRQSADGEISLALGNLRDRARDLVRNNPHAAKGIAVLVANRIGTGIMAQAAGPNARINDRIDERWKRWVDRCDLAGKLDLYGIQSLVERTRIEAGECLVRFVPIRTGDREDTPIRLQVLEPDYIDDTKNQAARDGQNEIRYGIEYEGGRPVAYWLYDAHPGDANVALIRRGGSSTRVPASEVIHYYKALRPGQTRGVTEFAPVMVRLRDLDDWHAAKLMRAKIDACLAAFVTTPQALPGASLGPTSADSTGTIETIYPAMVKYLRPGESITVTDPKPLGSSEFYSDELHAIASGLLMPYELLTGDLSEVNYSSHRGGLVQFRAMVEADQWQLVVPQLARPIWQRFIAESSGFDGLVREDTPATFTPPRFGLLDPSKEIPPMIQAAQAGLDSMVNLITRDGYDWREKLAEAKAFQDEAERLGLRLTSIVQPQVASGDARSEAEQEEEAA